MKINIKTVLKHKAINGWALFALIAIPISILTLFVSWEVGVTTAEGISELIGYSVRWAVPFIFIVVATSSLRTLYPNEFTAWMMRNRKYIGLCFAVAMAWQGLFILIISTVYREHYFENVYYFRDELEGTVGYIFLAAMIITSFQFARKRVNLLEWKLIQKGGIYFLWAYPFSVYWWNLFGYGYAPEDIALHDYLFYWMGFLAMAVRIAAWGKKRRQLAAKNNPDSGVPLAFKVFGYAMIAFGLVLSATGGYWYVESVTSVIYIPWSDGLSKWVPFWPLEPFFSLFAMGLGTLLLTKVKPQLQAEVAASPQV
jgi:DMSO/TMAO reductase YedYZ heme-binding membrane subunit